MSRYHDIIICGAGITGICAAYFLAKRGVRDILLLDERSPLSLTSNQSTECYRNWWPDPEMLALMNRSIDLLEELADESRNIFHLNRRGYLFVTAEEDNIPVLHARAERISQLGAGPLRIHTEADTTYKPSPTQGYKNSSNGADILLGQELLQKYFPYLTQRAVAALHIRRAGWLSAHQLGTYLLDEARGLEVRFESARVADVDTTGGRVQGVWLDNGTKIGAGCLVNAAGPFFKDVGRMMGLDLPVHTELHLKVGFKDHLGVVGRDAPLLIWDDPQTLPWNAEEMEFLAADEKTHWLTETFPSGVHTRPEGGTDSPIILILWEYQKKVMPPILPPPLDDAYPEIALRGLAVMLPGLRQYFGKLPRPILDGGYYTKTRENRPLIGPTQVAGAYLIGALSGYGIMSACAAGDLLAALVIGEDVPAWATAFTLARYNDPEYLKEIENWAESGQL